jgi:DNA processing protein
MATSFQLTLTENLYPSRLKEISKPPKHLWGEGDVTSLSSDLCLAIVGARECTPYGRKVAFDLARDLVREGVVIVSGLAYGIDTAAHQGALEGGGKTIAVLGCGIDIPYPSGNLDLKRKISQNGAVVTEFSPGTPASTWSFPQRNRIISGLSRGIIVIEAGEESGSLITADFALEQGRDVFAVPGNVTSPLSAGTNRLIQNGAKLVLGIKDILEEFKLPGRQMKIRSFQEEMKTQSVQETGGEEESKILLLLSQEPKHVEDLIQSSGFSIEKISTLLIALEIDGKISSLPGGRYTRS